MFLSLVTTKSSTVDFSEKSPNSQKKRLDELKNKLLMASGSTPTPQQEAAEPAKSSGVTDKNKKLEELRSRVRRQMGIASPGKPSASPKKKLFTAGGNGNSNSKKAVVDVEKLVKKQQSRSRSRQSKAVLVAESSEEQPQPKVKVKKERVRKSGKKKKVKKSRRSATRSPSKGKPAKSSRKKKKKSKKSAKSSRKKKRGRTKSASPKSSKKKSSAKPERKRKPRSPSNTLPHPLPHTHSPNHARAILRLNLCLFCNFVYQGWLFRRGARQPAKTRALFHRRPQLRPEPKTRAGMAIQITISSHKYQ